jgi:hypothetical protein
VQIDADACYPRRCGLSSRGFHHLSPLLFLIWAYPNATCEITYAHTGRFLHRAHYEDSEDEDEEEEYERKAEYVREYADFPTDVLNNLLVTLGKNDALNIKR